MKKNPIVIIIIFMVSLNVSCQTNKKKINNNLNTTKYAGVYEYGDNPENGPTGKIIIYSESHGTLLFFIDICKGSPSYNMGNLYDRVKIKSDKGIYYSKDYACSFSFIFTKNKLILKTINDCYDCPFGGNVSVDGEYYKVKNAVFDHFIDMKRKKYFFIKTKPEDYAKILK